MFISPGPELIQFGPFTLRWYGILIALSVLIGLNLSSKLALKRNLEKGIINDLLPIIVFASIIGARSYYVIFEWRNYQNNPFKILAIWEGGIAIHGALVAGTITLIVFSKLRHQSFWDMLDVLTPSVVLGQAIGRWGNFFNSEAFGLPTKLPWKLFIESSFRPSIYSEIEFFHPTFLYESIWNIILFAILITTFKLGNDKKIVLPRGALSCIYISAYSIGRYWIEGLRIDPLCISSLPPLCEGGIRVAQLVSLILFFVGLTGLYWTYICKKTLPDISKSIEKN